MRIKWMATILVLSATLCPAAEVWIGGSRAWGDYTAPGNETKWPFLRANADGLYINNFAMRPNESSTPSQADRIAGMNRLLDHHNLFYETDQKNSQDDFDRQAIAKLTAAGFKYQGVTINYGTNAARNAIITQNGKVPLYYMFGPWRGEGDIAKPVNADLRENIKAYAGASVDCPVVMWRDPADKKGTRSMVYSTIKWCHANKRQFLLLLAPNDSGPNFLTEAQHMVSDLEDHDALPDIWAVAFYGPQSFRDKLEVLPEADAAGEPARTFSGAPYWLIHHLRDPQKSAALSLPNGRVTVGPGKTERVEVDLINSSRWLDLVPLIRLQKTAGFTVQATLDGRDVTAPLTGSGLVFNRADRLIAGARRRLVVTLSRQSGKAEVPALVLCPHPSEPDRVNQVLPLIDVLPSTPKAAQ